MLEQLQTLRRTLTFQALFLTCPKRQSMFWHLISPVRCLNSPAQRFQLRNNSIQGLQKAQRLLVKRLSPHLPVGAPGNLTQTTLTLKGRSTSSRKARGPALANREDGPAVAIGQRRPSRLPRGSGGALKFCESSNTNFLVSTRTWYEASKLL
ncbi:hypothetical protein HPB47_004979 [Ixodes persulcatus]|uniref:Uncharacterized protein n=1 Tax=Ixodes persulcatus TaxID=34615 RepID=A0AC60PED4_IXOPE|nr:hypothetical protein HPB47_004979 [Ixodes persulcatus]